MGGVFEPDQCKAILGAFEETEKLHKMSASEFMDCFVKPKADIGTMLA